MLEFGPGVSLFALPRIPYSDWGYLSCSTVEEYLYFPFHLFLCLFIVPSQSLSVFISITVQLYLSFLERISGLPEAEGCFDDESSPAYPHSCTYSMNVF